MVEIEARHSARNHAGKLIRTSEAMPQQSTRVSSSVAAGEVRQGIALTFSARSIRRECRPLVVCTEMLIIADAPMATHEQ